MFDPEFASAEPSQFELLNNLIEESEGFNKKMNPEELRSRQEEEKYMKQKQLEEERILKDISSSCHSDRYSNSSTTLNTKIEVIDKLIGTKAQKLDPRIWTDTELDELEEDFEDEREIPDYDIIYQQKVSAMDAYLGIDPEKDPSTSCSDTLCANIRLPKTKNLAEIELDISSTTFSVKTEHYKLIANFPQEVIEKETKAKWNSKTKTLQIIVPVVR
ncbi:hypothetical protein FDP41_007056 [Naegleria fowleri]|uniref:PIH1D1/2/3 CS-like domain-containing protein n=1 Tax=Naegleria fowleri TaxID=5763 RepID=A0A6A5BLA6_NAEFO|nr:uncharacterized protein FDP41_007056 [Naegleria fowleri]KAF0973669.1 hypothetical protein FDP41_007056 [Naegleria fowleri]CAG4707706.1 unnamed protein product [Naegleria fowleri]